jgi:4-amino-4-deoxy-L-arabinose transferase-like glycosyltransferase
MKPAPLPYIREDRAGSVWLGVLAIVLTLSFFAQLNLTAATAGWPPLLFVAMLVAGLLAGAVLVFCFDLPSSIAPLPELPRPIALSPITGTLVAAALLCAAISTLLVHNYGSAALATETWCYGIILALIAAWWPARQEFGRRLWLSFCHNRGALVLLAGIVLIAAALRLPSLDSLPGFIHVDEGNVGLSAQSVARGQIDSIFSSGFMGMSMLGYAWDGLFLRVFGDSLLSLRASSAVLGLGSIVLTALLGKELYNWRAGLLAAALLSVYHLHIHFSRDGLNNIQALFMVMLTLYVLILALRYGSRLAAVLTGLALSLDLQVFFSARLAYVMAALIAVYVLFVIDSRRFRQWLPTLAWLALGFLVAIGPVAAFITHDWTGFTNHSSDSTVFSSNPETRDHMLVGYGTLDIWHVMGANIWRALQAFNFPGHTAEDQYPFFPHPMLDPVSAALLPSALALMLFRLKHVGFGVCAIAFTVIMLFIGTFSLDQPDWNRLLILVPILALLIGALLDALWTAAERAGSTRLRIPAAFACTALLVSIFYGNYQWYFVQFQPTVRHSFGAFPFDVGNYLRQPSVGPKSYAYAIEGGGFDFGHQGVLFLAPDARTCNIPPSLALAGCAPATRQTTQRLFFIMPSQLAMIPSLEKAFPGGSLTRFNTYDSSNEPVMEYTEAL